MHKYQEVLLLIPCALFLASCVGNQTSFANAGTAPSTTATVPASATTTPTTITITTTTTFPPCKNPNPPGHLCYQKTLPDTRSTAAVDVPPTSAPPSYIERLGLGGEVMQIVIDEMSTPNPTPEEAVYFAAFNVNCGQDTSSPACISWLGNNPPPIDGFPSSQPTTTLISSPCGWNINPTECMAIIKKHQSGSALP